MFAPQQLLQLYLIFMFRARAQSSSRSQICSTCGAGFYAARYGSGHNSSHIFVPRDTDAISSATRLPLDEGRGHLMTPFSLLLGFFSPLIFPCMRAELEGKLEGSLLCLFFSRLAICLSVLDTRVRPETPAVKWSYLGVIFITFLCYRWRKERDGG